MRDMRELELKVELTPADLARLEWRTPPADLSTSSPKRIRLRSIYYDTPKHGLHAAGISLRVRRQDEGWVQTVKADQHVDGVSNPIEVEASVGSEAPELDKITDKKLRRKIEKAIKATALHPVFETIVQRTTRKLRAKGGEVELAVDEGQVRTGDAKTDLREAELELKAGSAEALVFAAEKLLGDLSFELSRRSKAERGYRLALGKTDEAEPQKAKPARIRRKDDCATALTAILGSAARQINVNRRALFETDDPEAAHQLRIGLRRLRSALRTLRPVTDGPSLPAFERCARDLGRAVGKLRDADVLIASMVPPVEASARDQAGFTELREALTRYRTSTRDEVRVALRGPDWTKLQLYLTLWPQILEENAHLDKPITKHARKVLRKAWIKPAKLGRKLDTLDATHRHEMRKALKKLRYEVEFFAPLFSHRKTQRFIRQLKTLQDVFGYVNDARMASTLIAIQKGERAGDEAAAAAGLVVGTHQAEARHVWKGANPAWKKLDRLPRFWG